MVKKKIFKKVININIILFLKKGYHTIHHMYPGKHWSTLKEEHEVCFLFFFLSNKSCFISIIL